MTKEQEIISETNHRKLWKQLGLNNSEPYTWALHHKDETLRETDIERYIQWNPEDVVVMDFKEHSRLHAKLNNNAKSEEARRNISKARKGKPSNTKGMTWKLVNGKRVYSK